MQSSSYSQSITGSMGPQSQEPDKAREIFFLYDREATGKLSDESFFKGLLAGGARLTVSEFKRIVLPEFGSHPTLVVFKQALQKAKSRDETFDSLKDKFSSFGESVSVEALRYFVTFCPKDRLTEEECEEFIKLVDPEGTGQVTVENVCRKLMPQ